MPIRDYSLPNSSGSSSQQLTNLEIVVRDFFSGGTTVEANYIHSDYTGKDIDRHKQATEEFHALKLRGRGYRGVRIAVADNGDVWAYFILTRAPKAKERGEWNIPESDKRVLDFLAVVGTDVTIFLYNEGEYPRFTEIEYSRFIARAKKMPGKGGGPDYYQVKM